MKRYILGLISKFVCHILLQVKEIVLICQMIVMVSANV